MKTKVQIEATEKYIIEPKSTLSFINIPYSEQMKMLKYARMHAKKFDVDFLPKIDDIADIIPKLGKEDMFGLMIVGEEDEKE